MDPLVEMELLESRESVETPDLPEPPVPPARLALLDLWVPLANRETEERGVLKDLLGHLDLLVPEEWLDPKDHAETRERLARQERGDRRVTVVSPVCRVFLDLQVLLVTLALRALLDLPVPRDPLDQLDLLAKMVQMDSLALLDLLDLVDALERLVLLVLLETLDLLVPQVLLALESTCLPLLVCPSPRSLLIPSGT